MTRTDIIKIILILFLCLIIIPGITGIPKGNSLLSKTYSDTMILKDGNSSCIITNTNKTYFIRPFITEKIECLLKKNCIDQMPELKKSLITRVTCFCNGKRISGNSVANNYLLFKKGNYLNTPSATEICEMNEKN